MAHKRLFDLTEGELRAITVPVQQKIRDFHSSSLELKFKKTLEYQFGGYEYKNAHFEFEGSVGDSESKALEELYINLRDQLAEYGEDSVLNEATISFSLGEKCPSLDNLQEIPSMKAKFFKCHPGDVVILYFWVSWSDLCGGPMSKFQEIISRNHHKWSGRVKFVSVSLDGKADDAINRVKDEKWDRIDHYWCPGSFESENAAHFKIEDLPVMFLVDKKGRIEYFGDPYKCTDLEKKINELIETDMMSPLITEKTPPSMTWKEQEDAFKTAEEEFKSLSSNQLGDYRIGIHVQIENIFKKNRHINEGEVGLSGLCTTEDTSKIVDFANRFFSRFPKQLRRVNQLEKQIFPQVKFGTQCASCKATLGKGIPHYVCTTCLGSNKPDYAFCTDCADKEMKIDVQDVKDLFHPHGLLLIDKNADETALQYIVRQFNDSWVLDPKSPDFKELKRSKSIQGGYCDICNVPMKRYRWACAHCWGFDLCDDCFRASKDPTSERYKTIAIQTREGTSHDVDKHLFYRGTYIQPMEIGSATWIDLKKDTVLESKSKDKEAMNLDVQRLKH